MSRNFGVLSKKPKKLGVEVVFPPDLPINTGSFGSKVKQKKIFRIYTVYDLLKMVSRVVYDQKKRL